MYVRTAMIIGATGLVGTQLVQQLLADDRFGQVKIFVRRSTGVQHSKLEEHIIQFDKPEEWQQQVTGDVLFSTLGTTLKQAGSKEAQYKVDYTYQYQFAKAAAQNGVPVYVLVSSAMASPDARLFYTRIKGELERDVKMLPFQSIHILQPGMLDGDRKEKRAGEKIGLAILKAITKIGLLKSQTPVPASIVAKAMIRVSLSTGTKLRVYTLLEVFKAAESSLPGA